MAPDHVTQGGTRLRFPFVTLLIAAALAVGLVTGLYMLRSTSDASPIAAISASITPAVPLQACQAMDATAQHAYCSPSHAGRVTPPRVTFQACEAMDVSAYRMYCTQGDGGRWIDGS